jgi:hypothetical protein
MKNHIYRIHKLFGRIEGKPSHQTGRNALKQNAQSELGKPKEFIQPLTGQYCGRI